MAGCPATLSPVLSAADEIPFRASGVTTYREPLEETPRRLSPEAEGDANRFLALLAEYKRAPEVTRKRLYLETMQGVMSNTSKVMVDVEGGNNLLYLPLDKIVEEGNRTPARASGGDIVDIRELTDRVVEQIRRENAATRAGRGGR